MLKYYYSSKTYNSTFTEIIYISNLLWTETFKEPPEIHEDDDYANDKVYLNYEWGQKTPFLKVLIIRGIGYRGFITVNDLNGNGSEIATKHDYESFLYSESLMNYDNFCDEVELNYILRYDVTSSFFLTLRAGHTNDANWSVLAGIKNLKKNRKLVLSSRNKAYVNFIANSAWQYRKPSVYTGRGVRRKGVRVIRKAGKRDQKGRGF